MMYYTLIYKYLPLYGPLVILMVLPSNWLSLPPRPLPRPLPPPPPPRTPPPAPPPGPNSEIIVISYSSTHLHMCGTNGDFILSIDG